MKRGPLANGVINIRISLVARHSREKLLSFTDDRRDVLEAI